MAETTGAFPPCPAGARKEPFRACENSVQRWEPSDGDVSKLRRRLGGNRATQRTRTADRADQPDLRINTSAGTGSPSFRPRSKGEIVEAFWNNLDCDELSPAEQKLWSVLGWDAESWSGSSDEPASDDKNWSKLSDTERFAAGQRGYDEEIWDGN
jgi:hypothetical protein